MAKRGPKPGKKRSPGDKLKNVIESNHRLRGQTSRPFEEAFRVPLATVWHTNVQDFDPERFIDLVLQGDRSLILAALAFNIGKETGLTVLRVLIPKNLHAQYGLGRRYGSERIERKATGGRPRVDRGFVEDGQGGDAEAADEADASSPGAESHGADAPELDGGGEPPDSPELPEGPVNDDGPSSSEAGQDVTAT